MYDLVNILNKIKNFTIALLCQFRNLSNSDVPTFLAIIKLQIELMSPPPLTEIPKIGIFFLNWRLPLHQIVEPTLLNIFCILFVN